MNWSSFSPPELLKGETGFEVLLFSLLFTFCQ
jgi:hypothetical protein